MKKWLAILLLVGLAGCSPQGVVTAWHWKAFLRSPDEASFKPLYNDIMSCWSKDCPQGEQISEEMIDNLANLVLAKDPYALKMALVADEIVAHDTAGARFLNASFGPAICDEPLLFLQDVEAAGHHEAVVVAMTQQDLVKNADGAYADLGRRRSALMTVTDTHLIPLRDAFIAAIDKRRTELEPSLTSFPAPPPPPQMPKRVYFRAHDPIMIP